MNLFLLRHGLAVERDPKSFPDDSLRPLTLKGRERIKMIGAAMQVLELSFDGILSSPFLRARQTAETVAGQLELQKVLAWAEELTPEGDPRALVRRIGQIKPAPENLLLVGHEPQLSGLLALWITGSGAATIDFKKGGLAKLEVTEPLRAGRCAQLNWLLTPKQMALMG